MPVATLPQPQKTTHASAQAASLSNSNESLESVLAKFGSKFSINKPSGVTPAQRASSATYAPKVQEQQSRSFKQESLSSSNAARPKAEFASVPVKAEPKAAPSTGSLSQTTKTSVSEPAIPDVTATVATPPQPQKATHTSDQEASLSDSSDSLEAVLAKFGSKFRNKKSSVTTAAKTTSNTASAPKFQEQQSRSVKQVSLSSSNDSLEVVLARFGKKVNQQK